MDKSLRYLPSAIGAGTFLAVTYIACVAWDGMFPEWAMRESWAALLPGFEWWSWRSFFVGLAESFAYGFWLALALPMVRWSHRLLSGAKVAQPEAAHSAVHQ